MLSQRLKEISNEVRTITRDRDQREGAFNDLHVEHELMQNAVSVKLLTVNKATFFSRFIRNQFLIQLNSGC